MAVDVVGRCKVDAHVVLTKHIQHAILEAIRRNSFPQDLEKQLIQKTVKKRKN